MREGKNQVTMSFTVSGSHSEKRGTRRGTLSIVSKCALIEGIPRGSLAAEVGEVRRT
jgi:hypothetical protein